MAFVTCPTCGEKGRILKQLVGKRIKCQKCGTSFLVAAPASKAPAESAAPAAVGAAAPAVADAHRGDTITVEGLDETSWAGTAVVHAEQEHDHEPDHPHDESTAAFTAAPAEPHHVAAAVKEYKVLTSKDKFFDNKFDLSRLEDALNHYARKGWVVRSMATPHVAGFSGGTKEELVVLLER
jgi:hypothetical protein